MPSLSAIHQFAVTCASGDGITNGMLFTQRLVRASGLASEIYVIDAPGDMAERVRDYRDYLARPDELLLIHHGSGNPLESWLEGLACRKLLVYHNITPERFYSPDDPAVPVLRHGREQLTRWHTWLDGAIADSEHNRRELLEAGFLPETTRTLPLLVDLARLSPGQPAAAPPPQPATDAPYRLLFVGRLAANKNQAGLIAALAAMQRRSAWPVELTLVGGGDDGTVHRLQRLAEDLGVAASVILTGKVDDAELQRHYQQADLYLSLSEHEGFGMPLIEAMAHELPVLAYAAPDSSIGDTVGAGGLLLNEAEPEVAAAAALMMLRNPGLRAKLVEAQRERLARFEPARLFEELRGFLAERGMTMPALPDERACLPVRRRWRIEGPFDSSYSLALVNRELAFALQGIDGEAQVALHSTEGGGDFAPDPAFLDGEPGLADAVGLAAEPAWYDASLRLCYPPRTTGLVGRHRLIHSYGWEESVFPHEHAQAFNARLSAVTTMSRYVSRVLADSGVGLPLPVVGVGTDHLCDIEPDPAALADWLPAPQAGEAPMTFLHVSSCFPRKGVDVLLAAWYRSFAADDHVQLILKTFPNPHHDIEAELAEYRRRYPRGAPVQLINADLGAGAVRALYHHVDALVAPSRGEGFGLPMAEAMWCDVPVITTGSGGQCEFCTPETAWLIDYQYARARTHMEQFASVWVEPSEEHLAGLMSEFTSRHQNGELRDWTASRRQAARALVAREHSWAAVAQRTRTAVEALDTLPVLTPRTRIGWVSTWNSKCGIATYSKLLVTPALANQVTVLANRDAELIAEDGPEVVRCWEQIAADGKGGYLEDDLEALHAEILRRGLDTVVVQFNFSFFGLAPLATLLKRLQGEGVQTLVFFHSTADVEWGGLPKSLLQMREALAGCSRLMVHGIDDLNRLKAMGLDANATLFPHGVMAAPAVTPPADPRHAALEGKRVIASYGFLLPHKGVHELIEAFAMLAEEDPGLHLLLLNALYPAPPSEAEAERCRQTIARLGLEGRVTLINDFLPDDQTLGWLQAAQLLVFPYQHTQESSSAAVRWGLASGRPVACTPLGIFDDVAEAVAFLPGTAPAELASGIRELLDDRRRRERLQQDAAAWLAAHDWPRLSQRLHGLMTALAWDGIKQERDEG
ncbi:glycosyltransferase [Halomonas sp. H10-9-1]|uniref:glycosyltransferase family 4 protein n=1 Tax=Halomonas sp. H10-9-1 TaxID=2950871 RepID=UPI0032DFF448